jgi:hypothetical protein
MPQNFISYDRDQVLLLPPDLRGWLPPDYLAWFVLAVVEQMDLPRFRGSIATTGLVGWRTSRR